MFANSKSSVRLNKTQEYFRLVWGQKESRLFMLLVIMIAIMAILRPDTFFTSQNMFNILRQISLITIVAVAQTFIIISGGIDLSVGFSLGLCGIIISYLLDAVNWLHPYLQGFQQCSNRLSQWIDHNHGKTSAFHSDNRMSYIARGLAFE